MPAHEWYLFPSSNCAISMQTQVAEYKQLKDTLNRIPSFRKAEPAERPSVTQVAHSPQGDHTARERNPAREPQQVRGWWLTVRSLSLSSCHQVNCFSCRTTVLRFQRLSEFLAGLSEQRWLDPSSGFSDSANLGWGLRIRMSEPAGPGSTLGERLQCFLGRTQWLVFVHLGLFVWRGLWCPGVF